MRVREYEQVREREPGASVRQARLPARVDGERGLAVSPDKPNEHLRDDASADRTESITCAAMLGLLQDVEPQWSAVLPARPHLLGGQGTDPEFAGNSLSAGQPGRAAAEQVPNG